MLGQLTYRVERPKGFEPINDPIDLFFDGMGEVLSWVSAEAVMELAFELLFGLLEML